ncbi:MAG: cupin-like domain-containing protein [Arcobacter sp.]|nr:cupin-like domain-containing protein [Arcobacter sp.]
MFEYKFKNIEEIKADDTDIFKEEFLYKKPVLVREYFSNSKAAKYWSSDYFVKKVGKKKVKVTKGLHGEYSNSFFELKEYLNWLDKDNLKDRARDEEFYYMCNNTLEMIDTTLAYDLNFIPQTFVGEWYLKNWLKIMPIYYGNKNTVTPLHYDPLGSHNSFFQICGRKLFILIPFEQIENCYIPSKSGTSMVDLENPNFLRFPKFKNVTPIKAELNSGDLLYLPPYTLHYVKGEEINISMNIEWHTKKSVLKTFSSGYTKRPRHFFWNFLFLLGLWGNVPNSLITLIYKLRFRFM